MDARARRAYETSLMWKFIFWLLLIFLFFVRLALCSSDDNDTINGKELMFSGRIVMNGRVSDASFLYDYFDLCPESSDLKSYASLDEMLTKKITRVHHKIIKNGTNCQELCSKMYNMEIPSHVKSFQDLKEGIKKNHKHRWTVNTTATWCYSRDGKNPCIPEFPMGCYVDKEGNPNTDCPINEKYLRSDKYYIFNHVDLTIYYNMEDTPASFGLESKIRMKIIPRSIHHLQYGICDNLPLMVLPKNFNTSKTFSVKYTYSARFVRDRTLSYDPEWTYETQRSVYYFWLLLSILSILVMFHIIFIIVPYGFFTTEDQIDETMPEEMSWIFLYYDVFKKPPYVGLLCTLLGNGAQLIVTILFLFAMVCLQYCISYEPEKAVYEVLLMILFIMPAPFGACVTVRMLRACGEKDTRKVFLTSLNTWILPGFMISSAILSRYTNWGCPNNPYGVSPVIMAFICISINSISSLMGTILACREPIRYLRTGPTGVQNTLKTCCLSTFPCDQDFISGLMFTSIFISSCLHYQLKEVFDAYWKSESGVYVPLVIGYFMMLLLCDLASVLLCYTGLCAGKICWWYRPFTIAASIALYYFMYSMSYCLITLKLDEITFNRFFTSTILMTIAIFLVAGVSGFFFTFVILQKMYRTVGSGMRKKGIVKVGKYPKLRGSKYLPLVYSILTLELRKNQKVFTAVKKSDLPIAVDVNNGDPLNLDLMTEK